MRKIKAVLEMVRTFVLLVLAPVAMIVGGIYVLIMRIHRLQDELATEKAAKELGKLTKEAEIKEELANALEQKANDSERTYTELRDAFLRGTDTKPKSE